MSCRDRPLSLLASGFIRDQPVRSSRMDKRLSPLSSSRSNRLRPSSVMRQLEPAAGAFRLHVEVGLEFLARHLAVAVAIDKIENLAEELGGHGLLAIDDALLGGVGLVELLLIELPGKLPKLLVGCRQADVGIAQRERQRGGIDTLDLAGQRHDALAAD